MGHKGRKDPSERARSCLALSLAHSILGACGSLSRVQPLPTAGLCAKFCEPPGKEASPGAGGADRAWVDAVGQKGDARGWGAQLDQWGALG